MLNQLTAAEVSETTRALGRMDGNCGRKYRRFLGRLLERGDGHIHLVFAKGGDTIPVFKAKKAFAEHCLSQLMEDLDGDRHLFVVGLAASATTGDIRITLKADLNVETASVATMSLFCYSLRSMAALVLRYELDPVAIAMDFARVEADAKKRRAQMERQQNRAVMRHLELMRA